MANPEVDATCTESGQPFNYQALENPADDFMLDKDAICRTYVDYVEPLLWVAKSEKEAYDLYRSYAHKIGFSVRKEHHSFHPNSRKIKVKDFVCSRAGLKRDPKPDAKLKYQKSTSRINCKALIRWSVDLDGVWTVNRFLDTHNHDFAEKEDQHLLRSARCVDNDRGTMLMSMTNSGIRPTHAFSYLADEMHGAENVGFTKRDAYNYIQREKRIRLHHGDTTTLIETFKERESTDHLFAWDAQFDEDGRLFNFFWVDGGGRLDYDCFGDVLIFDTTYRLNKYNLACAPIIGVNNHWQSILLGVAFLSEETIEAFAWVFKSFLRIMGGKHPITIFTDQDQAMARAIETTMPNTSHRLCQWHISKKAPSKVPCFNSNKPLKELFFKCLSKCDSEEEFDEAWGEMISAGNLQSHPWLQDLHRIRHKWSTAFNKNIFSLGLKSTQRSESANNLCHGISKATSSITDCFLGMERLNATLRRNERDEEHRNSQTDVVPVFKSNSILKQAAKFYARKIYSFFEKEFMEGVGDMMLQKCPNNEEVFLIKSQDPKHEGKEWIVHFKSADASVQCSCHKFETVGWLCSHCLKVFSHNDVLIIPDQYLIPRWSSNAKKDFYDKKKASQATVGPGSSSSGSGIVARNHNCRRLYEIHTRAIGFNAALDVIDAALDKLSNDIGDIVTGKTSAPPKRPKQVQFKDPAKVRPKGISNSRLKGPWEKPKRKKCKPDGHAQQEKAAGGGSSTAGQSNSMPESLMEQHHDPKSNQSKEGAAAAAEDSGAMFNQNIWKLYGGFSTQ